MNVWTGVVRVVRDAKLSDSGKMASFDAACDRPFPYNKDRDGNKVTDFLRFKIIGEAKAKRVQQYLRKGVKVLIRGVVCRDTWKDGDKYEERNYIMVEEWEFAESKATSKPSRSDDSFPAQQKDDDFMNIDEGSDDEVPFD